MTEMLDQFFLIVNLDLGASLRYLPRILEFCSKVFESSLYVLVKFLVNTSLHTLVRLQQKFMFSLWLTYC